MDKEESVKKTEQAIGILKEVQKRYPNNSDLGLGIDYYIGTFLLSLKEGWLDDEKN